MALAVASFNTVYTGYEFFGFKIGYLLKSVLYYTQTAFFT